MQCQITVILANGNANKEDASTVTSGETLERKCAFYYEYMIRIFTKTDALLHNIGYYELSTRQHNIVVVLRTADQ